jgi:hypothetical protein
MKLRHGSFFVGLAASALMAVACSSSGSSSGDGGTTGSGGSGTNVVLKMENLISNFEDTVAVVTHDGTPPRNGYWYSYNDGSTGCVQVPTAANKMVDPPIVADQFLTMAPATFPQNDTGSTLAIHSTWNGCKTWGAGVGGDLNQPAAEDGGTYDGPKIEYDVSAYKGIVFWAMVAPGTDNHFRVKVNMSDETKIVDGGKCDETQPDIGVNKCSDAWGQAFTLPTNGTWTRVLVDFSDHTKFKQEGWGHVFPWTPAHAVSIQIQSSDAGEAYDLWVDDVYFWN